MLSAYLASSVQPKMLCCLPKYVAWSQKGAATVDHSQCA